MVDALNEPCLMVLKRGRSTNVTCGVGNELESLIREKYSDDPEACSKEWLVTAASTAFAPFFAPGFSGSLICDSRRLPIGIMTGGAGHSAIHDSTYFTPLVETFKDMESFGWLRLTLVFT